MPERNLDADTLRLMSAFEQTTGVQPVDCVENDRRIVFVVPDDEAGKAIGKEGRNVKRLQERLDRHVQVVAYADDPAEFARNYFARLDVEDVRMEDQGERTVAKVQIPAARKPRAIGKDGSNVKLASELARRHHDVDVVVE